MQKQYYGPIIQTYRLPSTWPFFPLINNQQDKAEITKIENSTEFNIPERCYTKVYKNQSPQQKKEVIIKWRYLRLYIIQH